MILMDYMDAIKDFETSSDCQNPEGGSNTSEVDKLTAGIQDGLG